MKNCELREITKEKLATALITAMEEKALDKITVKEIIEKAEVNRKTFYYYFPDIYGLLEWVISRECNKLVSEIQNNRDYENALNDVLNSIEKHRHLLNCIKDSVGRATLERVLYRELEQLVAWAMKIGILETGVADSYGAFHKRYLAPPCSLFSKRNLLQERGVHSIYSAISESRYYCGPSGIWK